jgi:hypothetical protein
VERVLLDSNVYNELLQRPDVVKVLRGLIDARRVAVLLTPLHETEAASTARNKPEFAARLMQLFDDLRAVSEDVPDGAALFGISPFGTSRWMGPARAGAFEANLLTRLVHFAQATGTLCNQAETTPIVTVNEQQVNCVVCRENLGKPVTKMWRHRGTGDAVLIETARVENAVFVTNEKGRAVKAADRHGVRHQSVAEFFAWVLA